MLFRCRQGSRPRHEAQGGGKLWPWLTGRAARGAGALSGSGRRSRSGRKRMWPFIGGFRRALPTHAGLRLALASGRVHRQQLQRRPPAASPSCVAACAGLGTHSPPDIPYARMNLVTAPVAAVPVATAGFWGVAHHAACSAARNWRRAHASHTADPSHVASLNGKPLHQISIRAVQAQVRKDHALQ